MDARIILGGQQPNFLNTMMQAQQAANNTTEMRRMAEMRNALREYGAGAVQGEQSAVNALAGLDPNLAQGLQSGRLNMDATRLNMDATRQDMTLRSRADARAQQKFQLEVAAIAERQTAAENAAQAERIDQAISRTVLLAQQGDLAGVNKVLTDVGEMNIADLSELPAIIGKHERASELFKFNAQQQGEPEMTTAMQTLTQRAQMAGLEPGTPEYEAFFLSGGKAPDGLSMDVGPDGAVSLRSGGAITTGKPPSERQSQIRLFGGLMDETMPAINAMEDDPNFDPTSLRSAAAGQGIAGNMVTSEAAQQYEALKRQWAEGVLRLQTGAAATEPEIVRVLQTYFPIPGDTRETMMQKRIQRDAFARSLSAATGGTFTAPGGADARSGLSGGDPNLPPLADQTMPDPASGQLEFPDEQTMRDFLRFSTGE